MATGGIFQLITNDGKQDRMLMASALLKQRLDTARSSRKANGLSDLTPTLYDIERTHILFTNAHFKPFAAIGYEYNKVKNTSGTASINTNSTSTVSFSIPQFGDFFSDMVLHVIMNQPTLTPGMSGLVATAPSDQSLMQWCPYIGERLLESVDFTVNGNPLDSYTVEATQFHREFCVQPNKRVGWNRCMGQEEVESGWVDQPNWAQNGVAPVDIQSRICTFSNSGLQTPTAQKVGDVELFIPLLFWCNKDPRLAIPSVAIPYGQRYINVTLAGSNKLVGRVPRGIYNDYATGWDLYGGSLGNIQLSTMELYINNIFVNPEVHNIFIKRIGFTLIRVHRMQQVTDTRGGSNSQLLQNLKWPIEALFLGMRVTQYTDGSSIEKNLDKWYRWCFVDSQKRKTLGWNVQQKGITKTGTTIAGAIPLLVNPATFTIGLATVGVPFTATANIDISSQIQSGDILSFTNATGSATWTVNSVSLPTLTSTLVTFVNVATTATLTFGGDELVTTDPTSASALVGTIIQKPLESTVSVCKPTLSRISIKAHGIPIYNDFPAAFYNSYLPYNYGGHNIKTPEDIGAIMITFCLYPGTYQPSGHINVSRAREFYIDYITTDYIGSDSTNGQYPGTMFIVASAINFLLISDGSAVLRYST